MIYLNNAATSYPKPESVLTSMMFAQRYIGASAGRGGSRGAIKAGEIIFEARVKISEMFGCEAENVIFTNNCTTALNTAIYGIAEKGDHFIISSLEHNSVLRPVHFLKEKGIINYDIAMVDPKNDKLTVENFSKLVRSNTKAIICTHASNVFGTVLPIEELGALTKRKDIIFLVDCAQTAGIIKINMKKCNIDILCAPGHKGLLGPMGTGIMLLSGRIIPSELTRGGTGSFSLDKTQPQIIPDKYESGTMNLPGIAGLLSGVKYIRYSGGEEALRRHETELTDYLKKELINIWNVNVYENTGNVYSPIVAFNVGNYHSEEVSASLEREGFAVRGGYQCSYLAHNFYSTAEKGVVRVSPGIFSTKNELKKLIFSINKIANRNSLCYNTR